MTKDITNQTNSTTGIGQTGKFVPENQTKGLWDKTKDFLFNNAATITGTVGDIANVVETYSTDPFIKTAAKIIGGTAKFAEK